MIFGQFSVFGFKKNHKCASLKVHFNLFFIAAIRPFLELLKFYFPRLQGNYYQEAFSISLSASFQDNFFFDFTRFGAEKLQKNLSKQQLASFEQRTEKPEHFI